MLVAWDLDTSDSGLSPVVGFGKESYDSWNSKTAGNSFCNRVTVTITCVILLQVETSTLPSEGQVLQHSLIVVAILVVGAPAARPSIRTHQLQQFLHLHLR